MLPNAHLRSSINLRLPRILPLAQHRRSKELVPVLATNEIRRLQEDRGAIVPGHALPLRLRLQRAIDGLRDDLLVRLVVLAQRLLVVRRDRLGGGRAFLDLPYRTNE